MSTQMSTQDMTLRQFLESYNLGVVQDVPVDILCHFGHTEESAADAEILTYQLNRPFEVGELVSIAVSYLIRSGFECLTVDNKMETKDGKSLRIKNEGIVFDQNSFIVAWNKDEPKTHILVSYNDELCLFNKMTEIGP